MISAALTRKGNEIIFTVHGGEGDTESVHTFSMKVHGNEVKLKGRVQKHEQSSNKDLVIYWKSRTDWSTFDLELDADCFGIEAEWMTEALAQSILKVLDEYFLHVIEQAKEYHGRFAKSFRLHTRRKH